MDNSIFGIDVSRPIRVPEGESLEDGLDNAVAKRPQRGKIRQQEGVLSHAGKDMPVVPQPGPAQHAREAPEFEGETRTGGLDGYER